jgi:hypothetical protein
VEKKKLGRKPGQLRGKYPINCQFCGKVKLVEKDKLKTAKFGRLLADNEIVHHVDGNVQNNMDKHRDNKTGRFKEKRMEELST